MAAPAKHAVIRSNEVRLTQSRAWVGPPGETCAEQPELQMEERQGVVVAIRLTCTCGRETRIELDYGDNAS